MDTDIDPSRPRQILAISIFFLVLTWIAVPLRVYSKIALKQEFVLDDKLLCLVQAIYTTYLTMSILGVVHGQGRDATEISPEHRRIAFQYFFFAELLYITTTILLKVCVGILLLRIAIISTHIWILRIILFLTILFGMGYLFLVVFQCRPVSKFWDESPRSPGHCFNISIVLGTTFTAAILNCIADCTFGLLPLLIVWSLHMRRKTKALVIILLGFASIASIATIIRAITIPSILSEENFLRDTTNLAIWSAIEPGIGISAACAPALCPIARQLCGNRQRQRRERGIWRTRPLPTINITIPLSNNSSGPMECQEETTSMYKPGQPHENSTNERQTPQLWPRTRHLLTRT
ncbi:hypothetical protein CDEST_11841 [Colletotrichum destructivum]|uniref:Rhodopsin domain-containing protein n=1 Tax=Colletotrichum destructivum TaxID=34406 RepID=A0AAX4IUE9_9PEZI|nr:hypothetical protein CDEST_11841 [Colletotrichum destructivum]